MSFFIYYLQFHSYYNIQIVNSYILNLPILFFQLNTMNLQNIEAIAYQACFQTNPEIKPKAQAMFMQFTFNLPICHYNQILENFSQTVLFVFLSYLDKKIPNSNQAIQIFTKLKQHSIIWYISDGAMKRNNDTQILKSYVKNTLGLVLGTCMKYIFIDQKNGKSLIQYFIIEKNSQFKLFLYKNFIEAVASIDNDLQYVKYRGLIYSFQDQMIPIFIHELYPYFISMTDNIKINQLSHMLPILNQKQQRPILELFKPQQKNICQLVFSLLHEIVNFKYNITIAQYDLETQFQNCIISFPETIVNKLISKQFLEAFYFMLQKMVYLNYVSEYTSLSFECLKKILLSKTTQLTMQKKLSLINLHYNGLLKLIKFDIKSQVILNQIFQCSYKFIHSNEFSQLNQAKINHFQWIDLIKQKVFLVIKNINLTNDNQLYHSSSNLMFKIASQSIAMSQQKYSAYYEQLCRNFYRIYFDSLIDSNHSILGKNQIHKISSLQTVAHDFFINPNKIGSIDMGFMFNLILSRVDQVLNSVNAIKISNLMFLIAEIIDETFYDRNMIFDITKQEDLKILGVIMSKCFQFIGLYRNGNISQKIIDIAILNFFEKVLTQCLNDLAGSDQYIKVSSRTYLLLNSNKKLSNTDQQFLLQCFKFLNSNLCSDDFIIVQHTMNVFYNLLLKLKWALKRQVFIQSYLSKQILQMAISLSKNHLQKDILMLKQRRKLFKIITILSFDDVLDSYRINIDFVTEAIQYDFQNRQFAKILFDMAGINQNIDTPQIYRYYLSKINERIGLSVLIKSLYEKFGSQVSMLQYVVYLNKSLIADKALRMSNKQLSILMYDIIDISLPNLSIILGAAHGQIWIEVLKQIFSFANLIFQSSYINIFLIKRKSASHIFQFVLKLIQCIVAQYEIIKDYPDVCSQLYETLKLLLIVCSQLVFTLQYRSEDEIKVLRTFIKLIQFSQNVCQKQLKELSELKTSSQRDKLNNKCSKLLEAISKFYFFARSKRLYLHKAYLLKNIELMTAQNKTVNLIFIQNLYKYGMSNIKNFASVLQYICITIRELSYFYSSYYKQILVSLGTNDKKIREFEIIFKKIMKNEKDDYFVINLKEWLVKNESSYQHEIDY